jgi:hypothetical protein
MDDGWITAVKQSLQAYLGLAILILAYVSVAVLIATACAGGLRAFSFYYAPIFTSITVIMAIVLLTGRALYTVFSMQSARPLEAMIADLSHYLTRRRLLDTVQILILLSLFMSVFISLKDMIRIMHPYNWDATLMTFDDALHFGIPPWRLLQPVFGYPIATGILSIIYGSWIFVLTGCCFWVSVSDVDQRLKTQYFVTFVLCFALLGNVAATWFASGGPCFYGLLVTGPDPYEPLMHYLRLANQQVPLNWSLIAQDMLRNNHASGSVRADTGISAMPSLHVAGATLCASLGWRVSRRLGLMFAIYLIFIMIGSVHLAWHYAIDGYAAILGTLALWWTVGAIMRRIGKPLMSSG